VNKILCKRSFFKKEEDFVQFMKGHYYFINEIISLNGFKTYMVLSKTIGWVPLTQKKLDTYFMTIEDGRNKKINEILKDQ